MLLFSITSKQSTVAHPSVLCGKHLPKNLDVYWSSIQLSSDLATIDCIYLY